MKSSITKEKGKATILGTISAEKMERYFGLAAREASERLSIKGFRPGKVPYETVAKSVGEEQLLNEVVTKALQSTLPKLYEDEGLEVIGEPHVTIKKLARNNPFEFEVVVPILPEITLPSMDNLKGIRRSVDVTDEELDHALEHLQSSRAKSVTVDRPAKKGDRVEIDFVIKADGVTVEDGQSKNHPLILGKGMYVPGFEEQMVDMKEGESKEFDIDVPGNYQDKRIAGRQIHCLITMNLVQEQEMPELTNEFAASLGTFTNMNELKASIREGLANEKKVKENQRLRVELIESVSKEVEVDIPEVLIERELEAMMEEFERSISGFGVSFDDYLKHLKKTKEELLEDWQEEAQKRVRIGLTLHAIATEQNVAADPEELEKRVNDTLKNYGGVEDAKNKIDIKRLEAHARSVLINEKVFDYLEKKATIKEE